MKRYVKEFANEILNNDKKNKLMQPQIKKNRKAAIEEILEDCKDGLITNHEALSQLFHFIKENER